MRTFENTTISYPLVSDVDLLHPILHIHLYADYLQCRGFQSAMTKTSGFLEETLPCNGFWIINRAEERECLAVTFEIKRANATHLPARTLRSKSD